MVSLLTRRGGFYIRPYNKIQPKIAAFYIKEKPMDQTKIARINALAKKAKTVGLNERETAERDALRKEYLAEMRASFKAQLDSTYVQTADGAKIPYAEYARTAKEAADDKK